MIPLTPGVLSVLCFLDKEQFYNTTKSFSPGLQSALLLSALLNPLLRETGIFPYSSDPEFPSQRILSFRKKALVSPEDN